MHVHVDALYHGNLINNTITYIITLMHMFCLVCVCVCVGVWGGGWVGVWGGDRGTLSPKLIKRLYMDNFLLADLLCSAKWRYSIQP